MNSPTAQPAAHWLMSRPYLLLSLAPLFWAGNAVVGRAIAGHFPPITLSILRWSAAFIIALPFAWPHLVRDWPAIRERLGLMMVLSFTGISIFNSLQYWALEYTEALNALLIQSSGPLFIAIWSLLLLGVRLTWAQAFGILVSLCGVLTILLRGDIGALSKITLNKGDIMFLVALAIFGFYSALSVKRPAIHSLSFLAFTFGFGALCLIPAFALELATRPMAQFTVQNVAVLAYVAVFPSILSYLCFNRGIELIGANRAAPFFHLIPVFGSAMAIVFLGEKLRLFHLAGYALVLAGVVIAARRPLANPKQRKPAGLTDETRQKASSNS
jgi:drug/metabolite transporter (DMT)-like permease